MLLVVKKKNDHNHTEISKNKTMSESSSYVLTCYVCCDSNFEQLRTKC